MNELVSFRSSTLPELVAVAGERASMRFLEFFAANIRIPHTRRAYGRAAEDFLTWCAAAGVPSIAAVQPVRERLTLRATNNRTFSPDSAKKDPSAPSGRAMPHNSPLWKAISGIRKVIDDTFEIFTYGTG